MKVQPKKNTSTNRLPGIDGPGGPIKAVDPRPIKAIGPKRVDVGALPPSKTGGGAQAYGTRAKHDVKGKPLPKHSPLFQGRRAAATKSPRKTERAQRPAEDMAMDFVNKLLPFDRMLDEGQKLALRKESPKAAAAYESLSNLRGQVVRLNAPATLDSRWDYAFVPPDWAPTPNPNKATEVPAQMLQISEDNLGALREASSNRRLDKGVREHLGQAALVWERREQSSNFRALRDHFVSPPEPKSEPPQLFGSRRPAGVIYNSIDEMPAELKYDGSSFDRLERSLRDKGRNGMAEDLDRNQMPTSSAGTAHLARQAFDAGNGRSGIALMELAERQGLKAGSSEWRGLEHRRRNVDTEAENAAVRSRLDR